MVSNVNISQKVCFFFTFLVLFSGCSSESPDISYQGVSAENALILLNRAKTTKEVDHIIARVDRDPRYGFDWKEFWEGVRPQVSKMSREQQESLFALGTKVCSPTAFNAFALTVSAYPEFHQNVLSRGSCGEFLDNENLKVYFSFYQEKWSVLSSDEITLLSQLLQKTHSEQNDLLRQLMDQVSPQQWTSLIQTSMDTNNTEVSLALVQSYGEVYGANGLVDVVFLPMTSSKDRFSRFLKIFGFSKALDFLLSLPRHLFLSDLRTQEQWTDILDVVGKEFLSQVYNDWSFSSAVFQGYQDYEKIHFLMKNLETKVPFDILLTAYDLQTRHMEEFIVQHQVDFFTDVPSTVLSQWLELRATGSVRDQDVLQQNISSSFLDQVHAQRIKVHTTKQSSELHSEVLKLCALYKQMQIKETVVDRQSFRGELLSTPGCVTLETDDTGESLVWFSEEPLTMSMSSVLITSGLSLQIEAPQMDGSVLDLSASYIHPDLPVQNPFPEDHASVFPVVMGFQVKQASESFSQGIYYVVTHYTAQKAAIGRPSVTEPLQGAPGGDLLLRVKELKASHLPQVVSEGGPGQKAVPATLGGDPSVSIYSWDLLQKNLLSTAGVTGDFTMNRRLLSRPNIAKLRELWSISEKKIENSQEVIATFVDSQSWWESLDTIQQNKLRMQCVDGEFSQACAMSLAEKAAMQLQSEILQLGEEVSTSFIHPRLGLLEFEEPAGALGPINTNGLSGFSGNINIEEMQ